MATALPQLVMREAEPPEADTSAYACILRDEPLCSLNDVRSGLPISGRPLQPHAQHLETCPCLIHSERQF